MKFSLSSIIITFALSSTAIAKVDYLPTPYTPDPPLPTPTTTPQTLVWSTQTGANGIKTTLQVPYTQVFTQMYQSVAVPPAGSIGLGKWKGQIGVVKPTQYLTLTSTSG